MFIRGPEEPWVGGMRVQAFPLGGMRCQALGGSRGVRQASAGTS